MAQSNPDEAKLLLDQSLMVLQEVGNAYPLARTWLSLAQWHTQQDDVDEARVCLNHCIPIFGEMDAKMDLEIAEHLLAGL